MRPRLPAGTTLLTAAVLLLLPALALLQYRWVGQVSEAERERMQSNLRIAASQFRDAFDGEIIRAAIGLQAGGPDGQVAAPARYGQQYDAWRETAAFPAVVRDVYVVDAAAGAMRLQRWDPERRAFDSVADWPVGLRALRPALADELARDAGAGRGARRFPLRFQGGVLMTPFLRPPGPPGAFADPGPPRQPFGFTLIELDLPFIQRTLLPELTLRHFDHSEDARYRVAVLNRDRTGEPFFRSDDSAPVDLATADAVVPLLARPEPNFLFVRRGRDDGRGDARVEAGGAGRGAAFGPRFEAGPPLPGPERRTGLLRRDEPQWTLVVQHPSGSLEAAVGAVRRRNLGISFGVLLLLAGSISLLAVSARRAHRLAQQQVEFVAGVSHELRTPVAVIRAAAENLERGVIAGDRIKQYGTTIGAEARRLGDMVERVLLYAGIDSRLRLHTTAALAPDTLIADALAGALPDGGHDRRVECDIEHGLPAVNGDAPALRSALENLIVNAAKYGGDDRYIGIRARAVRGRSGTDVHITVSDHGAGIPAPELSRIFEPFFRGANAAARQTHGNGLGLSLVKRIADAHGGRVEVDTHPGSGSAFTLVLPAAPDRAGASSAQRAAVSPAHS